MGVGCGAVWGGVWRCGAVWRFGAVCGGVGRCVEVWGCVVGGLAAVQASVKWYTERYGAVIAVVAASTAVVHLAVVVMS